MKMEIVVAGLLIGAGIAIAGLANRFEIETSGTVSWRVDGLTGGLQFCDAGSVTRPIRCLSSE